MVIWFQWFYWFTFKNKFDTNKYELRCLSNITKLEKNDSYINFSDRSE